jgi:L-lactate dehydrogenase (cytochrome)
VALCAEKGVNGVILSNHGGRACDYAPAPIDMLYEMRALRPELFDQVDVMMDGGVRSGADVVKALALGAKAVGLGRPFLYANSTHGQEGVERVCESEFGYAFGNGLRRRADTASPP